MKRSLLALMLAGMLCVGLTSCGQNRTESVPDSNNSSSNSAPDTNTNNSPGMDDTGSDLNTDTDTAPGTQTTPKRTSRTHRSAYDYLTDGRYVASADGKVWSRQDQRGRDLTQGARDLIRDAEQATKRAADDVGQSIKRAGESAGNVVRDMMQ